MTEAHVQILFRADEKMIEAAMSKHPQNALEWLNYIAHEVRLNYFSPGERIVRTYPKVESVRWKSPAPIDELIDLTKELAPAVWFSFSKAPMHHLELLELDDRLPPLLERGRFAVLDKLQLGKSLVYFSEKDFLAFKSRHDPGLIRRVGDFLTLAYHENPAQFAACGEYLQRVRWPRNESD